MYPILFYTRSSAEPHFNSYDYEPDIRHILHWHSIAYFQSIFYVHSRAINVPGILIFNITFKVNESMDETPKSKT